MPETATKFGITALPTDVIITPQGQVVESITPRTRIEATQYVGRLNQIASARQQTAGQMAQVPANIPARPSDRPAAEQPMVNNQPAGGNSLSDDRYANYYRRNPGDQRDQPPLSAAMTPRDPVQSIPAAISPPYAQQQPVAGPELSGPSLTQSPLHHLHKFTILHRLRWQTYRSKRWQIRLNWQRQIRYSKPR